MHRNDYIDCPPDELFDYMADTRCLEEWTYSLRGFAPTEEPGLWVAYDKLGGPTGSPIFTRTIANREAGTIDYHCAWDQGKHLWMIYLMRIVDAQVVFDKPGRLCCGPIVTIRSTTRIPIQRPRRRSVRCGWGISGNVRPHLLELKNLKAIAEYRHRNGLPVTPAWMR